MNTTKHIIPLLVLMTCVSTSHAWYNQNYIGPANGDWNNGANWDNGVAPGSEYPGGSGDYNSHGFVGNGD